MSDNIDNFIDFLKDDKQVIITPEKDIPEIFKKPKVPVREWVNDPYYVGDITIFPFWKEKLIEFYEEDNREVIVTGGTRSGKTYFSDLIFHRDLYELIYDFYALGSTKAKFGLDDSSPVTMMLLSTTIQKTHATTFLMLRNMLDKSQFLRDFGKRNTAKDTVLEFLDRRIIISVGASDQRSILSTDLYTYIN